MSCGYPNSTLRDRTAADTALAEKSKGDTPLGHVRIEALIEAFENLAYVRQRLADAEAERDRLKGELEEAEEAIRYFSTGTWNHDPACSSAVRRARERGGRG